MKKISFLLILFPFLSLTVNAQEVDRDASDSLSLRPINQANVLYKVTLWRRLDLREKQNLPFFAKGTEISKVLIDGVKSGLIDAYTNDSLTTKMTTEQFNQSLFKKFEGGGLSQEEIDAGFGKTDADGWGSPTGVPSNSDGGAGSDDGWGDGGSSTPANNNSAGSDFNDSSTSGQSQNTSASNADLGGYEVFPQELYLLELREDWIFDKQRSRQYYDIQTVSLLMPAELSTEGIEKTIATFKYKDLESYFRHSKEAVWYNTLNQAQNKNFADAFELRLFNGRIVKKANARGKYLDQIYKNPKEALLKSQEIDYQLLEFESNLWEY